MDRCRLSGRELFFLSQAPGISTTHPGCLRRIRFLWESPWVNLLLRAGAPAARHLVADSWLMEVSTCAFGSSDVLVSSQGHALCGRCGVCSQQHHRTAPMTLGYVRMNLVPCVCSVELNSHGFTLYFFYSKYRKGYLPNCPCRSLKMHASFNRQKRTEIIAVYQEISVQLTSLVIDSFSLNIIWALEYSLPTSQPKNI